MVVAVAGPGLLVVGLQGGPVLLHQSSNADALLLGVIAQVAADLQGGPLVGRGPVAQLIVGEPVKGLLDEVGELSQIGGDLGAIHYRDYSRGAFAQTGSPLHLISDRLELL